MDSGSDIIQAHWTQFLSDCKTLDVMLEPEAIVPLTRFYNHLLESNRTTNLTRLTAPEVFLDRHLLDSLSLVPLIPPGARLADIGSGAGFPAIPLALARPDVNITAVESVGKKCRFIESAKDLLGLGNLTVLQARAEELAHQTNYRGHFDIVTARAVASLPTLLELCLPLVKNGGAFLAMKGLSYEAELTASQNALKLLKGRLKEVRTFSLEKIAGSRVLVFEKTDATPRAYPRSAGLPAKKPL